jgi:hypothetical protein
MERRRFAVLTLDGSVRRAIDMHEGEEVGEKVKS